MTSLVWTESRDVMDPHLVPLDRNPCRSAKTGRVIVVDKVTGLLG
jgi:hypothetical protein